MCAKNYIIPGLLALGLMAAVKPAMATDDFQQLDQRISRLENQINQMQTQMSNIGPLSNQTSWAVNAYQGDPFLQMQNMQGQMDRLLHESSAQEGMNVYNLNVDQMEMQQKPGEYLITLNVPGMDKAKINIQLQQRDLVISGKKAQETEKKSNQAVSRESSYGYFIHSVRLPQDAEISKIYAKYDNGVLTVRVPRLKRYEADNSPTKIPVQ
jgi:HSP20 family protein